MKNEVGRMKLEEFMQQNRIGIFVSVDVEQNKYDIVETDWKLEYHNLFDQLVSYVDAKSWEEQLEGQLLPRIWSQGNTTCVIGCPNGQICMLFYECNLDAKDHYFHAVQLMEELEKILCIMLT